MQFNDPLDDGQAEARAAVFAGAGFLAAEELVENPHLVRGGDARTGVGDGHPDPGGLLEGAAGHRPSRDVVADGIVDQVDQRPLDLLPVRLDGQSIGEIGVQGEPAFVQQHLEFVENPAQERMQAEGGPLQSLGQLQPGEIEQVFDQLLHS